MNRERLLHIALGRVACSIASYLLRRVQRRAEIPLNGRIRRWWAVHSFRANARLDVPTYQQGHVQRQLADTADGYRGQTVMWETLELATDIFSTFAQLIAQLVVLFQVLRVQRDGVLLGVLTLLTESLYWLSRANAMRPLRGECIQSPIALLQLSNTFGSVDRYYV